MTWDEETATLFSSDIFGSYASNPGLHLEVDDKCHACTNHHYCDLGKICFMEGILSFHELIMTSDKALHYALSQIEDLPIERILPQHGNIIEGRENVQMIIRNLKNTKGIGIDGILP